MAIWRGPSGILLPQKSHPAAHCNISQRADEMSQTWKFTSYPEKYCNFYRRLLVRQFLLKWQRRLYAADYFSKKFKLELLIVQHAVRQLQLRRRWFVDFVDFVTCSQTTAIIKTAICSLLHMSWSLVAPLTPEWWRALCFEHNLTMGLILHEAVRQFIIQPFNRGVKLICPDINWRTIAVSWHN